MRDVCVRLHTSQYFSPDMLIFLSDFLFYSILLFINEVRCGRSGEEVEDGHSGDLEESDVFVVVVRGGWNRGMFWRRQRQLWLRAKMLEVFVEAEVVIFSVFLVSLKGGRR